MATIVHYNDCYAPSLALSLGTSGGKNASDFALAQHGFDLHGSPRVLIDFEFACLANSLVHQFDPVPHGPPASAVEMALATDVCSCYHLGLIAFQSVKLVVAQLPRQLWLGD